jgi:hypothetical protein
MAELSSAELSAIEAVNPAIQAAGFATKMRALQNPTITAYASDGAISFANPYNIATLTKGSAGAYTLAAPSSSQEGYRLLILCQSAYAHVVTATNLLDDGVTGGAKDTATMAAFVGASLDLIAINSKWHVVGKNVCTIAAV